MLPILGVMKILKNSVTLHSDVKQNISDNIKISYCSKRTFPSTVVYIYVCIPGNAIILEELKCNVHLWLPRVTKSDKHHTLSSEKVNLKQG